MSGTQKRPRKKRNSESRFPLGQWKVLQNGERIYISLEGKLYTDGDAYKAFGEDQSLRNRYFGLLSGVYNLRLSNFGSRSLASWGFSKTIVNAYSAVGITSLFSWQEQLLRHQPESPWNGASLVYSAPTSGGKTLVAELLMLRNILLRGKKALLIVPFVSICIEKVAYLRKVWSPLGIVVKGYYSNYGGGTGLTGVDVAVCTIERAFGILQNIYSTQILPLSDRIRLWKGNISIERKGDGTYRTVLRRPSVPHGKNDLKSPAGLDEQASGKPTGITCGYQLRSDENCIKNFICNRKNCLCYGNGMFPVRLDPHFMDSPIGIIVADEIHLLGENRRGVTYESLLSQLLLATFSSSSGVSGQDGSYYKSNAVTGVNQPASSKSVVQTSHGESNTDASSDEKEIRSEMGVSSSCKSKANKHVNATGIPDDLQQLTSHAIDASIHVSLTVESPIDYEPSVSSSMSQAKSDCVATDPGNECAEKLGYSEGSHGPHTTIQSSTERDNKVQFVGMSATLPNLPLVSRWIRGINYSTQDRPLPLREYVYTGGVLYESSSLLPTRIFTLQNPCPPNPTTNQLRVPLQSTSSLCGRANVVANDCPAIETTTSRVQSYFVGSIAIPHSESTRKKPVPSSSENIVPTKRERCEIDLELSQIVPKELIQGSNAPILTDFQQQAQETSLKSVQKHVEQSKLPHKKNPLAMLAKDDNFVPGLNVSSSFTKASKLLKWSQVNSEGQRIISNGSSTNDKRNSSCSTSGRFERYFGRKYTRFPLNTTNGSLLVNGKMLSTCFATEDNAQIGKEVGGSTSDGHETAHRRQASAPRIPQPISAPSQMEVLGRLCAESIHCNLSVLVFCSRRQDTESVACSLAKELQKFPYSQYATQDMKLCDKRGSPTNGADMNKESSEQDASIQNNRKSLIRALEQCESGLDGVLGEVIPVGVCFHHAGLGAEERQLIEEAFAASNSTIDVLVATTTLAAGVNLPVDRVIFFDSAPSNKYVPLPPLLLRKLRISLRNSGCVSNELRSLPYAYDSVTPESNPSQEQSKQMCGSQSVASTAQLIATESGSIQKNADSTIDHSESCAIHESGSSKETFSDLSIKADSTVFDSTHHPIADEKSNLCQKNDSKGQFEFGDKQTSSASNIIKSKAFHPEFSPKSQEILPGFLYLEHTRYMQMAGRAGRLLSGSSMRGGDVIFIMQTLDPNAPVSERNRVTVGNGLDRHRQLASKYYKGKPNEQTQRILHTSEGIPFFEPVANTSLMHDVVIPLRKLLSVSPAPSDVDAIKRSNCSDRQNNHEDVQMPPFGLDSNDPYSESFALPTAVLPTAYAFLLPHCPLQPVASAFSSLFTESPGGRLFEDNPVKCTAISPATLSIPKGIPYLQCTLGLPSTMEMAFCRLFSTTTDAIAEAEMCNIISNDAFETDTINSDDFVQEPLFMQNLVELLLHCFSSHIITDCSELSLQKALSSTFFGTYLIESDKKTAIKEINPNSQFAFMYVKDHNTMSPSGARRAMRVCASLLLRLGFIKVDFLALREIITDIPFMGGRHQRDVTIDVLQSSLEPVTNLNTFPLSSDTLETLVQERMNLGITPNQDSPDLMVNGKQWKQTLEFLSHFSPELYPFLSPNIPYCPTPLGIVVSSSGLPVPALFPLIQELKALQRTGVALFDDLQCLFLIAPEEDTLRPLYQDLQELMVSAMSKKQKSILHLAEMLNITLQTIRAIDSRTPKSSAFGIALPKFSENALQEKPGSNGNPRDYIGLGAAQEPGLKGVSPGGNNTSPVKVTRFTVCRFFNAIVLQYIVEGVPIKKFPFPLRISAGDFQLFLKSVTQRAKQIRSLAEFLNYDEIAQLISDLTVRLDTGYNTDLLMPLLQIRDGMDENALVRWQEKVRTRPIQYVLHWTNICSVPSQSLKTLIERCESRTDMLQRVETKLKELIVNVAPIEWETIDALPKSDASDQLSIEIVRNVASLFESIRGILASIVEAKRMIMTRKVASKLYRAGILSPFDVVQAGHHNVFRVLSEHSRLLRNTNSGSNGPANMPSISEDTRNSNKTDAMNRKTLHHRNSNALPFGDALSNGADKTGGLIVTSDIYEKLEREWKRNARMLVILTHLYLFLHE